MQQTLLQPAPANIPVIIAAGRLLQQNRHCDGFLLQYQLQCTISPMYQTVVISVVLFFLRQTLKLPTYLTFQSFFSFPFQFSHFSISPVQFREFF